VAQLPAYHRELQSAGYVTADITFENYFQLWRSATALSRSSQS